MAIDVCDRCTDRLVVRDAAEARLIEFDTVLRAARYGDALAILDELWAEHKARDHDGWLEHSLLAMRALVLGEQGDLEGAIAAQLASLESTRDPADFPAQGLALANLLERAARLDDAALACERGLAHAVGPLAPAAISLLRRYASIQQRREQLVPERYRDQLAAALAYYGLEAAPSTETIEAGAARAHQALLDAQSRYAALHAELARLRDDPAVREAAIQRYITAEPVEWFRQRAQELVGP